MHPRPTHHLIRIPTLKTLWNDPILLLTISLLINTITATILLHQAHTIRTQIDNYDLNSPKTRQLLSTTNEDSYRLTWAIRYEIISFYLIILTVLLIIRTINNGKQNGPNKTTRPHQTHERPNNPRNQ